MPSSPHQYAFYFYQPRLQSYRKVYVHFTIFKVHIVLLATDLPPGGWVGGGLERERPTSGGWGGYHPVGPPLWWFISFQEMESNSVRPTRLNSAQTPRYIYIYIESISTCTVLVPTVPYQYCIRIQCILVLPQNWHLRGLTHSTEWHSQLKCQLYVYWNSDWWSGVRNGKSDMADDLSWISTRIHCIPVGSHEPFGESRADSRVQRLDFPRVL